MIEPERVHKIVATLLDFCFSLPGTAWLVRSIYQVRDPRLERVVFGIRFPNPVGIAAGFDKEARLYNHLANFGFGHVETGTVTPLGQKGNPKPRLFRLPADKALINRMGFNNEGAKAIARNIRRNKPCIIIGGNIGKNTLTPNLEAVSDYCNCFNELYDLADYFVINVSCPNIAGLSKLQDKDELVSIIRAILQIKQEKAQQKPVLLKISPDLTTAQLDEIVDIVAETGLSGIIATNTSTRRDELISREETISAIGNGGLSGLPLRKKSTETIKYLHTKSKGSIPIIAVGGIFTAADAMEKLEAGASLVQVYTGFVYEGPGIAKRINSEIISRLEKAGQAIIPGQ